MITLVENSRLESFAEGRPSNGPTMQECIDMAKEILAMRNDANSELLSIARRWVALDANWDPIRYANEKIELLDDTRGSISRAEIRLAKHLAS